MTPDVARVARQLVASAPDAGDAASIAAHAAAICALLSQHLARLVGELGTRTLFTRSLSLASSAFPCVKGASTSGIESPFEALRRCLEQEQPQAATDAALHVFLTFIQLLERFIGAGLVASLLHEVWPTMFIAAAVKETR